MTWSSARNPFARFSPPADPVRRVPAGHRCFFFRPGGYIRDYSDLIFYQSRASWQDFGFLPYRDYWSEYPPLFAWLTVGIDRIARLIPAWEDQRLWFAALFGLLTVAAESLTLVALYRLARRIYGDGALRVAWLYAGSVPSGVSAGGMVRRPAGCHHHRRAGPSGQRIGGRAAACRAADRPGRRAEAGSVGVAGGRAAGPGSLARSPDRLGQRAGGLQSASISSPI